VQKVIGQEVNRKLSSFTITTLII